MLPLIPAYISTEAGIHVNWKGRDSMVGDLPLSTTVLGWRGVYILFRCIVLSGKKHPSNILNTDHEYLYWGSMRPVIGPVELCEGRSKIRSRIN
jgi:hypothetical protein